MDRADERLRRVDEEVGLAKPDSWNPRRKWPRDFSAHEVTLFLSTPVMVTSFGSTTCRSVFVMIR